MPYLIEEADFSRQLEIAGNNYVYTMSFLDKGVEEIELKGLPITTGYCFVKSLMGNEYRLLYKKYAGWYTLYAVKLVYRNEITYPKPAATQIMVWRESSIQHKHILDDITRLFFMDLLTKMHIVISDNEQTVHGMRFWKRMLEWAFYSGYHIYVADGTKGETWPKGYVTCYDELRNNLETYVWGKNKDVHNHRLLIISNDEIDSVPYQALMEME